MEERFLNSLSKYATPSLDTESSRGWEIPIYGPKNIHTVPSTGIVSLKLSFHTFQGFQEFSVLCTNAIEEKIIRENNPVVQRAYEEYQILLKLSK